MIAERISGGWSVADIINGHRVFRRYFGYSKSEALKAFKQEQKLTKEKL